MHTLQTPLQRFSAGHGPSQLLRDAAQLAREEAAPRATQARAEPAGSRGAGAEAHPAFPQGFPSLHRPRPRYGHVPLRRLRRKRSGSGPCEATENSGPRGPLSRRRPPLRSALRPHSPGRPRAAVDVDARQAALTSRCVRVAVGAAARGGVFLGLAAFRLCGGLLAAALFPCLRCWRCGECGSLRAWPRRAGEGPLPWGCGRAGEPRARGSAAEGRRGLPGFCPRRGVSLEALQSRAVITGATTIYCF